MDYSLLLGIHDMTRAEDELDDHLLHNNESEDDVIEEEDDDCSGVPTPPDSPLTAARERTCSNGAINPDVEIYAIESNDSESRHLVLDHMKNLPPSIFPVFSRLG